MEGEGIHRPPGRPRASVEERAAARKRVAAVIVRMGYGAGERPVHLELGRQLSLGRVRSALRELKAEHRVDRRRAREAARVHLEVHGRNVMWSVDATHLGRDRELKPVLGEVVRDVASTSFLGLSAGPEPTSKEVAALLERVRRETGESPLVLATDNGCENKGDVIAWCAKHDVVHLWSLPHTPEHNPWVEHGNRELKAEAGLGRGVELESTVDAAGALIDAAIRIDTQRPRATRAWKTPRQAYCDLPPAEALVDRRCFVIAATCAIRTALQDCTSTRERRLAEREAILATMERLQLVTRTRGCTPKRPVKPEGVS